MPRKKKLEDANIKYRKLAGNKWLELRETEDGYTYVHEVRCDGRIVAVLVYDGESSRILGRYEYTPCHHERIKLCSITGGMDEQGENPKQTAIRELLEEAGIEATADELEDLGTVWPSKAADTVVYLFAIDGHGKELQDVIGDGTIGEEGASVKWISMEDAIRSGDAILHSLLVRRMLVGGFFEVGMVENKR